MINAEDIALARRFIIGEDEVNRMFVKMLVDSGAYNLCINETIQEQLQLPFVEKRKVQNTVIRNFRTFGYRCKVGFFDFLK